MKEKKDNKPIGEVLARRIAIRTLLSKCYEQFGAVPSDFADEKTWTLFTEGRYVCPFLNPGYEKRMPKPKNFDELAEYVGRGFFIQQEFTVSMLLFIVFNGIENEKRLPFREDVDAFFEETFRLPHEDAQKIVRDIRNPGREEQGKRELHDLCEQNAVSEEAETAVYRQILRTRSPLSKREVAIFEARKIYQIAYYQANYPEEYANTLKTVLNNVF